MKGVCVICGAETTRKWTLTCGKQCRRALNARSRAALAWGNPPTVEQFLSKVQVMPNGCVEWVGERNRNGYGIVNMKPNGKRERERAHRVSYRLFRGEIPDGMNVLHHCDNPPCVGPLHLFLGTRADNVADMWSKNRGARIGCPGRKLDRILTPSQRLEIATRLAAGEQRCALAREFDIGADYVWRIGKQFRSGAAWVSVLIDPHSRARNGNYKRKLATADVDEIRTLVASGLSQREVGRRKGVDVTTIGDIIHGRLWVWHRSVVAVLAAIVCAAVVSTAQATSVVLPRDPATAVARADAVVIGTVSSIGSSGGETSVQLQVEEVKRGDVGQWMTLVEPGGRLGDQTFVVHGAPHYKVGDRVLVLAAKRSDGTFRTHLMDAGRIELERPWWTLGMGNFRAVPSSAGDATLDAWKAGAAEAALALPSATPVPEPGAMLRQPMVASEAVAFRFMGGKWLTPASVVLESNPDPVIGTAHEMVARALAAWSEVSGVRLEIVGAAPGTGFVCDDGKLTISFNDPKEEVEDPRGCAGTLAVGGVCMENALPGEEFGEIRAGAIVLNDGWDRECPEFWTETFVEEIVTHEGGHAIGLSHSCEIGAACDAEGQDATMYAYAHFDGRRSSLRTYDLGAVGRLYGPTALPSPAPTRSPSPTVSSAPVPSVVPTAVPPEPEPEPTPRGCKRMPVADAAMLLGLVAGVFLAGRRRR